MKLIVGLGNPGNEYKNTRHNVGFSYIDYFCNKYNVQLDTTKFKGIFAKITINGVETIIAKPMTFMNLSGDFVLKVIEYFKIDKKDILVIHDDLDTSVGSFKIKQKGSSGGQNGLKHILQLLKTEEIKRIKIGISRPKTLQPISDYVLSRFSKEDEIKIINNFDKITDAITMFINDNFLQAMNKYN